MNNRKTNLRLNDHRQKAEPTPEQHRVNLCTAVDAVAGTLTIETGETFRHLDQYTPTVGDQTVWVLNGGDPFAIGSINGP